MAGGQRPFLLSSSLLVCNRVAPLVLLALFDFIRTDLIHIHFDQLLCTIPVPRWGQGISADGTVTQVRLENHWHGEWSIRSPLRSVWGLVRFRLRSACVVWGSIGMESGPLGVH